MSLDLVKGQVLDLKKADGTNISKVRVGLSWDVSEWKTMDLDLFVHHKESAKTAYFGNKGGIAWVQLSDDNLTGEWDGDDEFAKMDATITDDGNYFICVNIYNAESKGQSLKDVKSAMATVYDDATWDILAKYNMTADGGDNTSIIVGKVIDLADGYKFEAIGTYLKGDINQVVASI